MVRSMILNYSKKVKRLFKGKLRFMLIVDIKEYCKFTLTVILLKKLQRNTS